ncbi:MFS transporter [Streptomyces sp. NPDC020597]|uniref:MFS transporter n=1 Tax=unclassified Streptomyces TaxID=2593676 RepID=UPI0037A836C6
MRRNTSITLLSVGHACVDVYQGAVASLVPFFVAERSYTYAVASGIVLAASLLSSVAQPVFGALTDRRAMPWLLPAGTLLGGVGVALSGLSGSYPLTLVFVAVSGVGVAAYHPESARVARIAGRGSHRAMGWFSTGGNIGFASAPLMVTAVVATGGLRWTPLLVLPALVGAALCLPVVRALQQRQAHGPGTAGQAGSDDVASFVKLSLAVVFRSIAFVGLSAFISLYARERLGGGTAAGTAALTVLYLGSAVGSVLGGYLASRWDRVTVSRRSYLIAAAALAGVVWLPGPAVCPCVALTSAGLYVPFSLQVTLGQDYLPSRVGTAGGITLGLTVSVGGLAAPAIGTLADSTSLRTALTPLVLMPLLSWLSFRDLPEPAAPHLGAASEPKYVDTHDTHDADGMDQADHADHADRADQGTDGTDGDGGDTGVTPARAPAARPSSPGSR